MPFSSFSGLARTDPSRDHLDTSQSRSDAHGKILSRSSLFSASPFLVVKSKSWVASIELRHVQAIAYSSSNFRCFSYRSFRVALARSSNLDVLPNPFCSRASLIPTNSCSSGRPALPISTRVEYHLVESSFLLARRCFLLVVWKVC